MQKLKIGFISESFKNKKQLKSNQTTKDRSRENLLQKVKAVKELFRSSLAAIDDEYLIMLHIVGNVYRKF